MSRAKTKATLAGLLVACGVLALGAAPAQAAFGLNGFDVFFEETGGIAATQAGSHPFQMTTSFGINYTGEGESAQPDGEIKDATFAQIAGLVGDPKATEHCATADFLAFGKNTGNLCSNDMAVGVVHVLANKPEGDFERPVYNLIPPPGTIVRLGLTVERVPVVIDIGLSKTPPYTVHAELHETRQVLKVFGATLTLWGRPAESAHDPDRGHCAEEANTCPTTIEPRPFLTLPTSCQGPVASSYEAISWPIPPAFGTATDSGFSLSHDAAGHPQGFAGCEKLNFQPSISAQPTAASASTSSGLDFTLKIPQQGLQTLGEGVGPSTAPSDLKRIEVALPEGVTANPSLAEGLGTCTEADLAREAIDTPPGGGCPNSSKIGTVAVDSPLLEETVPGAVYVATPNDPATAAPENPFDSLIAFYLVLKDPRLGILVKQPVKVAPDPRTGQLVTTLEDLPQVPYETASFHFREGQRAPLVTPSTCGTYTTTAKLTPWSRPDSPVSESSSFQVTSGVGGGECPSGGAPFEPGFEAGSDDNAAKRYSPFAMRLTRADGQQDMTRFSATLPPGVGARLAGVDHCPDAQIALARTKTGRAELASPSCPANSKIGTIEAGAGVGSSLTYVPGSLYLAGPYNGAPLSAVAIVPAVAGPFDVGTVVVRQGLRVDPRSGQVSADGSASDPLPHILAGIPLLVRDVQVRVDRPTFTYNPTSCAPFSVQALIGGGGANPFSSLDDTSASRETRYQAADCQSLPFKPRLDLRLRGGTRRGAFPALRLLYRPRGGDANLRGLSLRFPRSEFIEQGHFRTICTRVQFAAGAGHGADCPANSVYGHVRVFTPVLSEPLEGPVFLRSSSHKLPDVVLALHGPPSAPIDLEVASRIDSVHGGLRATAQDTPDAPVSRVVLNMRGGQKGLFVNSTDICRGSHRATAAFSAQNGRRVTLRPPLRARCPKHRRHKRHKRHRRR